MSKKRKTFVVLIMFIVLVAFIIKGCTDKKESSSEVIQEDPITVLDKFASEQKQKTKDDVNKLVSQYNAKTDWWKGKKYTVEFQNSLIDSNKSIIFKGSLEDIVRKNKQNYLRFKLEGLLKPEMVFTLKCDSNQVSQIISAKNSYFNKKDSSEFGYMVQDIYPNKYFVVAKIDNIQKPKLMIDAWSINRGEAEWGCKSGNIFFANGVCVDFIHTKTDQ